MENNQGRGPWGTYKHVVGSIDKAVNRALGSWGALVAARPVVFLVVSLALAIALSLGLPFRIADKIEDRSEKLWCALASEQIAPRPVHDGLVEWHFYVT